MLLVYDELCARYTLERVIGAGGEGVVFHAVPTSSHRAGSGEHPIALKMDSAGAAQYVGKQEAGETRFDTKGLYFKTGGYTYGSIKGGDIPDVMWHQYRRIGGFPGKLFPEVYEFASAGPHAWYTMEELPGTDMRRALVDGPRRHFRQWAAVLHELVEQLWQLNRNSGPWYWHGDIKPENIIILDGAPVRLVDPAIEPNCDGAHVGMTFTVQYNPLGEERGRADVVAITVLLIELLLGENPYRDLKFPLRACYCSSWITAKMTEQQRLEALRERLSLPRIIPALPKRSRSILERWLCGSSIGYHDMLRDWDAVMRAV